MSPIKFEENIKEELENRTIAVSGDSWDKLSNRLGDSQNTKKKSFWWIGIAASAVIALWFTVEFVNSPEIIVPSVVIEPVFKEVIPMENNSVETNEAVVLVAQEEVESNNTQKQVANPKIVEIDKIENEPQIVKVNTVPIKVVEITTLEDQKIQEIVAFVMESNKQNELVTDTEIENLMLQAQEEMQLQKLFNDTSTAQSATSINADALLYEVESELDKTFRDKVFKELKIQFKSIKNAVAQRNN
jgi:hypothetical protein